MEAITALVIDDSPVMRKMIERGLRSCGLEIKEVLQAGDGVEGVEVLAASSVTVVLCDMNMPRADGLDFLKSSTPYRKDLRPPVILVTTEEAHEPRVSEALSMGAGHIKKPFTAQQLHDRIVSALSGAPS